jgi:eukaryotic-like serine/threonine-protein kinase
MPVVDAKKRFGPFELDARTGELRANGARIKLQGQPISVLQILLETPGELVTREQIRERLWSSDTFVDFDHNLNTAIKKLRQALGDEAETPRYIETIPRYGYRFIGQVEKDAMPEAVALQPEPEGAETENAQPPTPPPIARAHRALPWALGVVAILFACIIAWLLLKPAPQPRVIRFAVAQPDNAQFLAGGEMSISPDGRYLAFVARPGVDTAEVLWLRPLDSDIAQPVPGTEGAQMPFWSPDSRQIAFLASGKLQRVSVTGGAPQIICDAIYPGGTWGRDGVILFVNGGSIYRVPDTGGAPTLVLAPDPARHEAVFRFPQFLPDGRHFLFVTGLNPSGRAYLEAGSLDAKPAKQISEVEAETFFVPPGYLLYTDQRTLMARPFDAKALRFTGPPQPVAQNIGETADAAYAYFHVSPAGVLAYETGYTTATSQITWFNRTGDKTGIVGQRGLYTAPALSPDGNQFAVAVGEFGRRDIWIYDLKRGTNSRLTFGPGDKTNTTWSPDGTSILFSSNPDGPYNIYEKAANGLGGTQLIFQSPEQNKRLDDLSLDGRYAIYDTAVTGAQLWGLPLFGARKPFLFVQGNFNAISAAFSPDGRYVAYASNDTGSYEVYVQTFPQQSGKWQISAAGGLQPRWSRDGKELFYLALDGRLMAVDVSTSQEAFQAGIPKPLFQTSLSVTYAGRNMYVVSPDAQRFLLLAHSGDAKPEPITVVVNWPALLKSSGNR